MKAPKKLTPAKSGKAIAEPPSFQPCFSLSEILANFIARKTKSKKHSGDNESSHLQDFTTVARFLIEQKNSFSTNDALALSRSMDTPCEALIPLIHEFVAELVRCKRCKVVRGAYDWEMYQII